MNAVITTLELDKEDVLSKTICFIMENLSDSSFIVNSFISNAERSSNTGLVLVSFRCSFDHYNMVGLKSGYNLTGSFERGTFFNVDVTKDVTSRIGSYDVKHLIDQEYLSVISNKIKIKVEEMNEKFDKVVVLVDCISDILNFNVNLKSTLSFFNHLRLLTILQPKTNLVVGTQCSDNDDVKISLRNYLLNMSEYRIVVSPLKTGFSTEVSGSLKYSKRNDNLIRGYAEDQLYHFKATDRNVKVFAPGTIN